MTKSLEDKAWEVYLALLANTRSSGVAYEQLVQLSFKAAEAWETIAQSKRPKEMPVVYPKTRPETRPEIELGSIVKNRESNIEYKVRRVNQPLGSYYLANTMTGSMYLVSESDLLENYEVVST